MPRARAALRAVGTGDLGRALALFIGLRLAFSLVALLASLVFQLPGPCSGTGVADVALEAAGPGFRLLGVWQRWDACWYERIATHGYRPGDPSVTFFPLYPLLMRALSPAFFGNLTLGGLVVSGAAYVAAMAGLYRLVGGDFDRQIAGRTVLYLSTFPTAFFLFLPYSEALFLALAVWTLDGARRGAWGWTAPAAFLVGLTRTQGCLLALPLAWEVLREWRRGGADRRRPWLPALVPALPIVSCLLFLQYSQLVAGWTTFQAQRARWGFIPRLPWQAVGISGRYALEHGDIVEALNLAALLLFALLLLLGLRRLPFAYTLYAAPQLLLIGTRQMTVSPLLSSSRLVLVLFPGFTLLAILMRRRGSRYLWLAVSTALLFFLLLAFLNGRLVA